MTAMTVWQLPHRLVIRRLRSVGRGMSHRANFGYHRSNAAYTELNKRVRID